MNPTRLFVIALLLAPVATRAATFTVTPDRAVYQVGDLITLHVLGDAEGGSTIGIRAPAI
jgi:hypothetical protein